MSIAVCFTFFITSGPDLEDALSGHSMVPLELGQAIIGGETDTRTNKIYHLECSQETWYLSKLEAELSIARESFVAIPIPDFLSGCITEGKALPCVFVNTFFRYNAVQSYSQLLAQ